MYHADERSAVELGISKTRAANDDAGPANLKLTGRARAPSQDAVEETAGWNAYDVWCTRIRDPRRQRELDLRV
jgi:hypothetical protein